MMNLKKKIAMAMAVAAVCCSIGAPVKAEAACIHNWTFLGEDSEVLETYHHGHLVGDLLDNNYIDCTITIKKVYRDYKCENCRELKTDIERIVEHSVN